MTDKERFIKRAEENGAAAICLGKNTLEVISINGIITTIYYFDDNGNFLRYEHK